MIEGQSSSSSNQPLPVVEDRDTREKRASKPRDIYDPSNVPSATSGRKKMGNRQKNVASDGHDHNKWAQYGHRIKSNLSRLRRENHFVEVLTLQKRDSRSNSSSNGGNILLDEVTRCLERITNAKLGNTLLLLLLLLLLYDYMTTYIATLSHPHVLSKTPLFIIQSHSCSPPLFLKHLTYPLRPPAILSAFQELAGENSTDRVWTELADEGNEVSNQSVSQCSIRLVSPSV